MRKRLLHRSERNKTARSGGSHFPGIVRHCRKLRDCIASPEIVPGRVARNYSPTLPESAGLFHTTLLSSSLSDLAKVSFITYPPSLERLLSRRGARTPSDESSRVSSITGGGSKDALPNDSVSWCISAPRYAVKRNYDGARRSRFFRSRSPFFPRVGYQFSYQSPVAKL